MSLKMNWHRLEDRIRAELRTVAGHKDTKDFALIIQAISDILGEETGRGYELHALWWKEFEARHD